MTDLRLPLTFNERQLMEFVLRGRGTSRAVIADATGLTPPTVSRLVTSLVENGLLTETADRAGQKGQPRKTLSIRKGQAYSIGINFMRGRFDLAIVDLAGDIVAVDSVRIDRITVDSITALASERAAAALRASRIPTRRVVGAGISLPGGFAPDGKVLLAHEYFPDLDRHALAPAFCEALAMPCNVDTDGVCATLGEFLYGAASAYDTFFLLHIGHGVGGGAVLNGQLFRGAHGNASKPGVLFPYDTPRPSGQDLVEYLQHNGIDIADIFDLAALCEDTEPLVENWLDRSAGQIAEVGRVITAFIDPEVIFVGGRLPDRFNTALVDRLTDISLPGPSRGLPNAPFKASTLGTNSGVLGAACLPIFASFMTGSQISAGNAYRDGRRPLKS
ncbi:ROK family transcriptional regulator [Stappia sp. BW2]|uniref:ROK family transcriptional regulator n=1 Tax=Stappia sp. BW2 TaxID=2592622 RepID=UPI0011DEDE06|nr:ROK family transcriptional regulator [Stappia sp. BW2]TYC77974.1 ROK family transcriptional regulator [Stappia sp. BW2]